MKNKSKINAAYLAGLQIGAVLNDMYLISKGVRDYSHHYIDFELHDLFDKEVQQYLSGLNSLAAGSRKIKMRTSIVNPLLGRFDFKSIYFECWADDKEKEVIDLLRKEALAETSADKHTYMGALLGYDPALIEDFVRLAN